MYSIVSIINDQLIKPKDDLMISRLNQKTVNDQLMPYFAETPFGGRFCGHNIPRDEPFWNKKKTFPEPEFVNV